MTVRAKFRVVELKETLYVGSSDSPSRVVVLAAVGGELNKSWARWTPSGQINMTIDNPPALEPFKIGKYFYVDFNEAPEKDLEPAELAKEEPTKP